MKVFGGCPSLKRNQTPTRPGLELNSVPHASQHSGRKSYHCAIESRKLHAYSSSNLISGYELTITSDRGVYYEIIVSNSLVSSLTLDEKMRGVIFGVLCCLYIAASIPVLIFIIEPDLVRSQWGKLQYVLKQIRWTLPRTLSIFWTSTSPVTRVQVSTCYSPWS